MFSNRLSSKAEKLSFLFLCDMCLKVIYFQSDYVSSATISEERFAPQKSSEDFYKMNINGWGADLKC